MSLMSKACTLSAAFAACAVSWAAAGASASNPGSPAATESLQEVTVTAQRAKLAQRVSKFVEHIAAAEDANGLPRWNGPVCPLVLGFNEQTDHYVHTRVIEVARAAGLPRARDKCHANLIVLVTASPKKFFRGLGPGVRRDLFGDVFNACSHLSNLEIDEFSATPRAVSVWYQTLTTDDWGKPAGSGKFCTVSSDASHILRGALYDFSRVWVIADYSRLRGVSLEQFASYVAMVALAKIRLGAHTGDSPSILTLFRGKPQAAPDGLTDWDELFLKSLYSTGRETKLQTSEITRAMVHDLMH